MPAPPTSFLTSCSVSLPAVTPSNRSARTRRRRPRLIPFRGNLNQQLLPADLPQLERSLNHALAHALPSALRHRPQEVGMDYHDQPYYGKTPQEKGLWVRATAKAGTTRVYRVATAYVIWHGLHLTLAIKIVSGKQSHKQVLQFLLKRLKALPIELSLLYLDRGFAAVEVIRFLHRLQ